jgi:integrase
MTENKMTAGRRGSNVEIRGQSLRVSFTWCGKRCRETLKQHATPATLKYAERLVARVNKEIETGCFDYAATFPESKTAKLVALQVKSAALSFGESCELWLKTKGRLADATKSQYANALNFWKLHLGAEVPTENIKHSTIAAKVGSLPWASAKLCNNYLIPLRGVFALAGKDDRAFFNPMEDIDNGKTQAIIPDPLDINEMERILKDMREHYNEQVFNYFEFAFLTGMRPEELIALRWDDIDWNHKTIQVSRAKTFKGTIKEVKTYVSRDVDLVSRAVGALNRQKKHTFHKSEDIFENPNTAKPWHDDRSQRDHFWRPTLKRLGIRMRRPYQTRHTYATTYLSAGGNPTYVSRQMGHKNAKMLFTVYAKWIDSSDRGREKEKMEAVLRSHSSSSISISTSN